MLSIDEAIAFERQQAKDKRNEHYTFGIQKSKEAAEEHEQLAEWLEELKAYRAIGTVEECKNSVLDIQKAYNKAIDDAKSVILQTLDNEILVDTLHLRLEQLKAGGENGKKKYIELSCPGSCKELKKVSCRKEPDTKAVGKLL